MAKALNALAKSRRKPPSSDGRQHREPDPPPVGPRGTAEVGRRLPPRRLQSVDRRQRDEQHQRDLEVQVHDRQPSDARQSEVRAVQVVASRLEDLRRHARSADQGQEGEGQHDAAHVGGNPAERGDDGAQPLRPSRRRRGVREQGTEDGARAAAEINDSRTELQKASRSPLSASAHRLERTSAGGGRQRLVGYTEDREEQEDEQEGEERHETEPGPAPAGLAARPGGHRAGARCPPGGVVSTTSVDPIRECWAKRLSPWLRPGGPSCPSCPSGPGWPW